MTLVQRGVVREVAEVPKPQGVGGQEGDQNRVRLTGQALSKPPVKSPTSPKVHKMEYCFSFPELARMIIPNTGVYEGK